MPGNAMLHLMLNSQATLETVLPTVERAMLTGSVCTLHNIDALGLLPVLALTLLAGSGNMLDLASGRILNARPGFCLIGVDRRGVSRKLAG